ncbi:MAG: RNA polymerase sigma factor [Elusimicrobia bacterium]|nr:RNA polymerase sigma factor [Elusimicrobiota bacterium]
MDDVKGFVERYTPQAYAIAFRLTGDRSEAWDLVQNAMLRVLKSHERYDPAYQPEQWLHQILRHLFIDRLRVEARRRESPLESDPESGSLGPVDTLVDPAPGPDEVLDRESDRDAVQAALSELPVEWRMAVALVDLEGYSYEEAAGVLELPASTLGVHVFRGRKALKKALAKWMEER